MINFFRNIRQKLSNEGKFQKYFRYAFGEVLLIMVGIFLALQLQNWNEMRKQEVQFKATVAQLHNSISNDINYTNNVGDFIDFQITKIDSILRYPNHLKLEEIIANLYLLSRDVNKFYISDSKFHAENLNYNPGDSIQNNIAKIAIRYVNSISTTIQSSIDRTSSLLLENEISFPQYNTKNAPIPFNVLDTTYYSKAEINRLLTLMQSERFKITLKSIKTEKEMVKNVLNVERGNFARYVNGILENYDPSLKKIFKNVGIIGTSINGFDDVGAKSTPMVQIEEDKNIWEVELYLKKGAVKFRCNDNWDINWGGINFPKGHGWENGPDILVNEAGTYHIILNLNENTYEFIKQETKP